MIKVIKKEKGNVLIKTMNASKYFANLAFSPNGNALDAIQFDLEMISFNTKEERDNYIENTLICSNTMDCFVTIARSIKFNWKFKEGDKKLFCIEPTIINGHFVTNRNCYVLAGKSRLGIHLWIYLNSDKEDFGDLDFPKVEPDDIYTYTFDCKELSDSFLIKYVK